MRAADAMAARRFGLKLVIFDCDGVLIDSERVASRVVANELTLLGWPMDADQAQARFVGMNFTDMAPLIAAQLGRPLAPEWRLQLMQAVVDAMEQEAVLIDGALEAMAGVEALGLPWRIASNSSHQEMAVKFARTGLTARVAGRVHSHADVARGKPAPDLFLATAAAQGVRPCECVVIEDSVPGSMAARLAGMDCLGYAPHGDGMALAAQGAYLFRSMREVPDLLAVATQVDA